MAASLKDNRTLSILNKAAAGKYGVLAAIAYAPILNESYRRNYLF
jgi:hypothetical protein